MGRGGGGGGGGGLGGGVRVRMLHHTYIMNLDCAMNVRFVALEFSRSHALLHVDWQMGDLSLLDPLLHSIICQMRSTK